MKIKTLNTVKYEGVFHDPGTVLDVSEETANHLLDCGAAVKLVEAKVEEPKVEESNNEKSKADEAAGNEVKSNQPNADESNTSKPKNNSADPSSELSNIDGLSQEVIDTLEAYGVISLQDLIDTPDDSFEGTPGLEVSDMIALKKSANELLGN